MINLQTLIKENLGNICGIMAIFLWSFTALFTSYANNIPPLFLAGIIALLLFLIFLTKWSIKKEKILNKFKIDKKVYALIIIGIGFGHLTYYLAFKQAPPFMVNLIHFLWPMFLILSLALIEHRKLKFIEIFGAALSFTGILFISLDLFNADIVNIQYLLGYLLALTGSIIAVLYCIGINKVKISTDDIGAIYLLIALINFSLYGLFGSKFSLNSFDLLIILTLVVCSSGTLFWNYAFHNNGNIKMLASFSYFIPLFSSLLLWLFLDIELSEDIFLSALFIISGAIICNYHHRKRKRHRILWHILHFHPHRPKKHMIEEEVDIRG